MARTLGYARISTGIGQDLQSQRQRLEALGAVVVFADVADGATTSGRSQLDALLRLVDDGDRVLALHSDRLARDTSDLLMIAKTIVAKGGVLEVADPKIVFDGTDIMSEVLLTVFGMIGSIEKHFIRARQARGIEAAKARGAYKGRPARIDPSSVTRLLAAGEGATAVAARLGISRSSVYRLSRASDGARFPE